MALSELERKAAHLFPEADHPDPFGRKKATPNEISQAIQAQTFPVPIETVNHRTADMDWKDLKRQREKRRIAARTLRNQRR